MFPERGARRRRRERIRVFVSVRVRADSLCEKIGLAALRKINPDIQADVPGNGSSTSCMRLLGLHIMRISVISKSVDRNAACKELEQGSIILPRIPDADLRGVGDYACGVVVTGSNGVLISILAWRGETPVEVFVGLPSSDAQAVQATVIELATTVMQRI